VMLHFAHTVFAAMRILPTADAAMQKAGHWVGCGVSGVGCRSSWLLFSGSRLPE
jgi:hypothetical protein